MKALLVALLLVLAASPLTAPFSVHTPLDARGDLAAWASPTKVADDFKTDAIPASAGELPGVDWWIPDQPVVTSPALAQRQDRFPLRL